MRDAPFQSNEHLEIDAADQSVQRAWDRFAASEHSDDIGGEDPGRGWRRRGHLLRKTV
jgi:hypothetical protein